jgi:protein TonB
MGGGTALVLGLLIGMNECVESPQKEEKQASRDFTVEKKQKKKEPPRRPRERKRQTTAEARRRAPMPDISTPLSGLSFDLPEFQTADLMGADQLLGGDQGSKQLVMTEDSVDSLPQPRSRIAPEYPARARQRGIQGHVLLKLRVNERGEVAGIRVVEARPIGVFEDVAIAAVEKWVFEPARYQGNPVSISVSQKIPFRLN